jgi:transposase InsO family protein
MSLAEEQEALVRALVAGAPLPEGFDAVRVGAAARALLRKRTGEVLLVWPALDAGAFVEWAADRPTQGSWRDGWDFAREHRAELSHAGLVALAMAEALWAYDGVQEPRRRMGLRVRRSSKGFVVALGRRARQITLV